MDTPTRFNDTLRTLFATFRNLPSQLRGRLHIQELQSKMNKGMRYEHTYAINTLGPLLLLAGDEISAGDARYFLARAYEIDVQRLCRAQSVNYDDAINTVYFMKDSFTVAPADVRACIVQSVQTLLGLSAQWAQAGKK